MNIGKELNNITYYFTSSEHDFFWWEYLDTNNGRISTLMINVGLPYPIRTFKSI